MMSAMIKFLVAVAACLGLALGTAVTAQAEPDVFGLITPDEQQEVWNNGNRNCVTLDQAGGTESSIGALIDRYQADGWDLESSVDIVWESVTGRCSEYLGAVKRVARTYGDPS